MPETITIRPTTLDDVPALRTMHAQSWIDTYPSDEHKVPREWVTARVAGWLTPEALAESRQRFEKIIGNQQHMHQIATKGLKVVGMIHTSRLEDGQHLEALYIEANMHGTGLAHRFMDLATEWYDLSQPIDLEVAVYNSRAIKFYEKYEFVKVPGSDNMFLEILPVVGMKRNGGQFEI